MGRFDQTGSWNPGDYQDLTHHASYVLALLAQLESVTPPRVGDGGHAKRQAAANELARPNQRIGAVSNAHVGRAFERVARDYFLELGIALEFDFPVELGLMATKTRRFDLGSDSPPMLVECKSHTWTAGDKVPSAKLTVWNEAMYYFHLAPESFRKCLFVLHHKRRRSGESLLDYYLRTYSHLIPPGVEFFEWDEATSEVEVKRVE